MAKVLYCNDLVPGCKFEARGMCEEEVIAEFANHLGATHNVLEVSDQVLAMISKAIREEVGVRARATAQAKPLLCQPTSLLGMGERS